MVVSISASIKWVAQYRANSDRGPFVACSCPVTFFIEHEIESGSVKETIKTWSSSKVVSIRRGTDKRLYIEGQFAGDSYVYQRATFDTPNAKFEQAIRV